MILAVIPARFGSVRLPGKALARIGGVPMVVRVWGRVRRAVDRAVVATDDERIAEAVRVAGGDAVLTGPCESGTDRVAEAARGWDGTVVNVQGDEPFIDPEDIARVARAVSPETPIVTGAAPYEGDPADPSRVKVVVAGERAVYFSRLPVPYGGPWRLHVGLYAYTPEALRAVAALPPSALERSERLEQLRWLEAGHAIRVVAASASLSVDTAADLERARQIIEEQQT